MFWKKKPRKIHSLETEQLDLSVESLKRITANMADAEIIDFQSINNLPVTLIFIRTLTDLERLNETIIEPLTHCSDGNVLKCIISSKITKITTLEEAKNALLTGFCLIYDSVQKKWLSVPLENPLGRSIESSETETILYGPKDSFTEQIERNINMLRRRLPIAELKTETFTVGSLTKTTVILMYIEGIANPEIISIARKKIAKVNYDLILESSNLGAFLEDHIHSVFPQFQQTDRPDQTAYNLGLGKIVIMVNNTPFVLIAPVTFFHFFQSSEDYIHKWVVASFLRSLRMAGFWVSITLIPFYVALTTHHYQMIPLQLLFVLMESRSKLPFSPFWEGFLMLLTLEVMKEASLRMPTKTSQTLGVIGGIVIGQAAVEAGFASKILIVLVGISAISTFLVPNYLISKTNTIIQFIFLVLASFLGIVGIVFGEILLIAHLNGLTSLKQPFLAPLAPLQIKDWKDFVIRAPLPWLKTRPEFLRPVQKWRFSQRRK
ncbi:spore germination protein [Bacillus sp. CECT 9360]|uniref:spore germination protein n=1 Tax=Bacillus sp. CECT 9360 TaxID=2845821 RepID=UPI001E61EF9E|nr:spore germination protein [Bacillus sp. CECT 9360]CAH0344093.1 Spore germination protein A1 [Bacillus sp. CECT 9360]